MLLLCPLGNMTSTISDHSGKGAERVAELSCLLMWPLWKIGIGHG